MLSKEEIENNIKIEEKSKEICKEVNMKFKGATYYLDCKYTESFAVVRFRDYIEEIQLEYFLDIAKDYSVKMILKTGTLEKKDTKDLQGRIIEILLGLKR